MQYAVQETTFDIWDILNGRQDINDFHDRKENRDWVCLTTPDNKQVILQKRYIFSIEE